jgi:hypothetical protein
MCDHDSHDIRSLLDVYDTLSRAMPLVGARDLGDGPTAEELAIQERFANQLQPQLLSQYQYGARRADDAPEPEEGEEDSDDHYEALLAFFLALLALAPSNEQLEFVISTYAQQSFNYGGQEALNMLGIGETFNLQDADVIADLQASAADLVDPDSDMSITRTTAQELAAQVRNGQREGLSREAIAAALSAYIIGRALQRSRTIAQTEEARYSRRALIVTYANNGIRKVRYKTAPELTATGPCPVCLPYEGSEYRIRNGRVGGPAIPQHPYCVCYYEPIMTNWEPPAAIWIGYLLAAAEEGE